MVLGKLSEKSKVIANKVEEEEEENKRTILYNTTTLLCACAIFSSF
jgi:hypothetical protein